MIDEAVKAVFIWVAAGVIFLALYGAAKAIYCARKTIRKRNRAKQKARSKCFNWPIK